MLCSFHIVLCCVLIKRVKEKCIKPYFYNNIQLYYTTNKNIQLNLNYLHILYLYIYIIFLVFSQEGILCASRRRRRRNRCYPGNVTTKRKTLHPYSNPNFRHGRLTRNTLRTTLHQLHFQVNYLNKIFSIDNERHSHISDYIVP